MLNSKKYPLITCLCITRGKPEKLQRAIHCFQAQTYQHKELLIIYEDDDQATIEFFKNYERNKFSNIFFVQIETTPKLTLGELRNLAIKQCSGEYFCQWDDDDWYHRDRLLTQMNGIIENYQDASLMTNWLLFDDKNKQAYFSLFRLWEGSVLCKKNLITKDLQYPAMSRLEDAIFINLLVENHKVYPIVKPNLYIYVCHGNNTWPRNHFERMFSVAHKLPPHISKQINDILQEKYSIEEACEILDSGELLSELKFFSFNNINVPNKNLSKYIDSLEQ